jgi:hypothetical protein
MKEFLHWYAQHYHAIFRGFLWLRLAKAMAFFCGLKTGVAPCVSCWVRVPHPAYLAGYGCRTLRILLGTGGVTAVTGGVTVVTGGVTVVTGGVTVVTGGVTVVTGGVTVVTGAMCNCPVAYTASVLSVFLTPPAV